VLRPWSQTRTLRRARGQVARDLYITVKTVEYHVSQIFIRLGIDGRAEIAATVSAPKS
jgi:DNA-binding NarL/FixJ family response regulator